MDVFQIINALYGMKQPYLLHSMAGNHKTLNQCWFDFNPFTAGPDYIRVFYIFYYHNKYQLLTY